METLHLALDWTVNTNHSGFIVALEKGFYSELGLAVKILTPADDNYAVTPMKKLELGLADFALCPIESILSFQTKSTPFLTKAIATIFQEDLSAIVSLKRSDIITPSDLDGKSYASYRAKYEDMIVQEMIKNDGGKGEINIIYPEKLGIWDTLLNQKADSTWIFSNWEGVEAKMKGINLQTFTMEEYGIPYGYSPVITTSESHIEYKKNSVIRFLKASKRGFEWANQFPEDTANILLKFVPEKDQNLAFLIESQKFTNPYYGTEHGWGKMNPTNVQLFLNWLSDKGLENTKFNVDDIAINLV